MNQTNPEVETPAHNPLRLDRLKQLLAFGKAAQLHQRWDFGNFNTYTEKQKQEDDYPESCGTAGCLLGEMPGAFCANDEDQWVFIDTLPMWKWWYRKNKKDYNSAYQCSLAARDFFGITDQAYRHLFMPEQQNTAKYGGWALNPESDKRKVLQNLEAFIAYAAEGYHHG